MKIWRQTWVWHLMTSFVLLCSYPLSVSADPNSTWSSVGKTELACSYRSLSRSNQLERMILDEMQAINTATQRHTQLYLTEDGPTASYPNLGIIIGARQIQMLQKAVHFQQQGEIIRFILAHEQAHQLQYDTYSVACVQDAGADTTRVFECQADILGAEYFIEALGNQDRETTRAMNDFFESLENHMPYSNDAIRELSRVTYYIGSDEFSPDNHPSHEGRRTAARLGGGYGFLRKLQQQSPDRTTKALISQLQEKLNVLPTDSLLDWSFRQAARITHYHAAASTDIVLSKKDFQWNTNPSTPYVTFAYTYLNTGKRTIKVSLEVQCVATSRANSLDTEPWLKWSVKNYTFVLKPGKRYTAKGKLEWYGDETMMPRIVYPPDPLALYACEYVDQPSLESGTTPMTCMALTDAEISARNLEAKQAVCLQFYLESARHKLDDRRAGMGMQEDTYTSYRCNLPFPGALETRVYYHKDSPPSLGATVYKGMDLSVANTIRANIAAVIHAAFPAYTSTSKTTDTSYSIGQITRFTDADDGDAPNISLDCSTERRTGKITVKLWVHAPWPPPDY